MVLLDERFAQIPTDEARSSRNDNFHFALLGVGDELPLSFAHRNPIPWVFSAKPPLPRAAVLMSACGLCQDPPRMTLRMSDSGPLGFRRGARL